MTLGFGGCMHRGARGVERRSRQDRLPLSRCPRAERPTAVRAGGEYDQRYVRSPLCMASATQVRTHARRPRYAGGTRRPRRRSAASRGQGHVSGARTVRPGRDLRYATRRRAPVGQARYEKPGAEEAAIALGRRDRADRRRKVRAVRYARRGAGGVSRRRRQDPTPIASTVFERMSG